MQRTGEYLPAAWTDVGPRDPFVEQAQGRVIACVEDLLALANMTQKECNTTASFATCARRGDPLGCLA